MKFFCWLLAGQVVATLGASSQWQRGCTATLNGGTRDCCPATGLCKDSSCVVFGFKNSAKANCAVNGGKCPNVYCNWQFPDCPKTSDGNHCYGTVACKSGVTCTSSDGVGQLCLEDGNSDNFKICGSVSCNQNSDCAPNGFCGGQGNNRECYAFSPSPDGFGPSGTCTPCMDAYRTGPCMDKEKNLAGQLAVDAPGYSADDLLKKLNTEQPDAGCTRLDNCDTIVCTKTIRTDFTSCSTNLINVDGTRTPLLG